MKKNILYSSICVFLVLGFISCDLYPEAPEESTVTGYAPFGVEGLSDVTLVEQETTLTMDFTLNERQILDVDVIISVDESSTATEGVDFSLSTHEVPVLALGGGGSFDVILHEDFVLEDTETIVLNIGGGPPLGLPETTQITITMENLKSVLLEIDWQGTFEYAGSTFNLCPANSDVDVFVWDDTNSDVTGYAGATGDCPELVQVGGLGDGTFTLVGDLWANGLNGAGLGGTEIPINVKIFSVGVETPVEVEYNTADTGLPLWNGDTVGSDSGGSPTMTIGFITISGTSVTLLDHNSNVIGTITN